MSLTASRPLPFVGGLSRFAVLLALAALVALFSALSPAFLTPGNIASLLVNNFALLAIVALATTLVVSAGGIDLSIGTAVDMAALTFVSLILAGQPVIVAGFAALGSGALVGAFNAVLIAGLGISPFLATLGTLFIGRSAQQLLTGGGNPVYLPQGTVSPLVSAIGHGSFAGIPAPLLAVALAAGLLAILSATRFGRAAAATGVAPGVARHSGLRVGAVLAGVYVAAGLVAAIAGIILSATVNVYVPYSGNAFLLNAIGATFIGTTFARNGRPSILGTLVGVLLVATVANGLLLTGISFYWQQVATGLLILTVLAASFRGKG